MPRMRTSLRGLLAFTVACTTSTAPCVRVERPGCWTERTLLTRDDEIPVLLRVHYPDCARLNRDSLIADGWRVTPDSVCLAR